MSKWIKLSDKHLLFDSYKMGKIVKSVVYWRCSRLFCTLVLSLRFYFFLSQISCHPPSAKDHFQSQEQLSRLIHPPAMQPLSPPLHQESLLGRVQSLLHPRYHPLSRVQSLLHLSYHRLSRVLSSLAPSHRPQSGRSLRSGQRSWTHQTLSSSYNRENLRWFSVWTIVKLLEGESPSLAKIFLDSDDNLLTNMPGRLQMISWWSNILTLHIPWILYLMVCMTKSTMHLYLI